MKIESIVIFTFVINLCFVMAQDKINITELETYIEASTHLEADKIAVQIQEKNLKVFNLQSGPNVALKLDGKDSKYSYIVRNYESREFSWMDDKSNSVNVSPELVFSPHDISGTTITYSQGYSHENTDTSVYKGDQAEKINVPFTYEETKALTSSAALNLNITQLAKMQYLVNLEKKKLSIANAELDLNIARQELFFSILETIMNYYQTEATIKTNEYNLADDEYNLEVNRTKYGENSARYLDNQFDLDETIYNLKKYRQSQTIKENKLYFYLVKNINDININEKILEEMVMNTNGSALNFREFVKETQNYERFKKLQNNVIESHTELKQFPKSLIPEISIKGTYDFRFFQTVSKTAYEKKTDEVLIKDLDTSTNNSLSASLTLNVPLEKYTTYKYQQDINKLNYIKSQKRLIQEQENQYLAYLNDRQKFNDNKQDITYQKQQLNRYQDELTNKKRLYQADLVNEFDVIKMEKKLEQIKAKYKTAVVSSYYYARKLDAYFKIK